jgi:ribulose-5-phosphate 4-epimerase/fuculose-1-phosphate aldolase
MKKSSVLPGAARVWLRPVAAVAAALNARGWTEAGAGNFSIRLDRAGRGRDRIVTLLTKRTGARMRDISDDPEFGVCVVRAGPDCSVVETIPAGAIPTTELRAHVLAQLSLLRHRPEARAVLHCHPTATVALSLLLPEPGELLAALVRMHSEAPLLVQGRVRPVRFHPPGTDELARATAAELRRVPGVIWPMHGVLATGTDLAEALDIIEVTDKCASIALAVGPDRLRHSGLSLAQEIAIADNRR